MYTNNPKGRNSPPAKGPTNENRSDLKEQKPSAGAERAQTGTGVEGSFGSHAPSGAGGDVTPAEASAGLRQGRPTPNAGGVGRQSEQVGDVTGRQARQGSQNQEQPPREPEEERS